MAKAKVDIPAEMWLNVASDALARYAAAGEGIEVSADEGGVVIYLPGMVADDLRLAVSFVELVNAHRVQSDIEAADAANYKTGLGHT